MASIDNLRIPQSHGTRMELERRNVELALLNRVITATTSAQDQRVACNIPAVQEAMGRSLLDQLNEQGTDASRVNAGQHLARSRPGHGYLGDMQPIKTHTIEHQGAHNVGDGKDFGSSSTTGFLQRGHSSTSKTLWEGSTNGDSSNWIVPKQRGR